MHERARHFAGECKGCGCTDMAACDEGCFWVAPGLCSACVDRAFKVMAVLRSAFS